MRAFALIALLAACGAPQLTAERLTPEYLDVATRALTEDLVNVQVEMTNALSISDVADFADCAVAGYTLGQGWGFARHVRTSVETDADLWRADAYYTLSAALPAGIRTIDAEVVAAACAERGIPTV